MGEVGCLKDGNFQNLEVENTILNSLDYKRAVVNITTTPYAPSVSQSGTIFSLDPDGDVNTIVVNLPAAVAGLIYEFHVANHMSGSLTIQGASANDCFRGLIKMSGLVFNDADDTATPVADRGHCGPSNADHQYIADADTKGRSAGTYLVFKCIANTAGSAAGRWSISGHAITAGAIATPFT
jgi:hypothetical protein